MTTLEQIKLQMAIVQARTDALRLERDKLQQMIAAAKGEAA